MKEGIGAIFVTAGILVIALFIFSSLVSITLTGRVVDINSGLIARYSFEDNFKDSVGNYNGINHGATFTTGKVGKAVKFIDFKNNYVELPSINPATAMTVSLWVRSGNAAYYSGVWQFISKYDAYALGVTRERTNKISFKIHDGSSFKSVKEYTISTPGKWHYFTATFDSRTGKMIFYVGGVKVSQYAFLPGARINLDKGMIHLGHEEKSSPGENQLNGEIDELRIYERALTQNEIREIYLSER